MRSATVFENLLLINSEINQKYVYPNLEKNRLVRFFYRQLVKYYRRQLMKRIDRYEHNSFEEMLSFLNCCVQMYPPKGQYRNIHSIIVLDHRCTSSIVELDIDEHVGGKQVEKIIYTIACYIENPSECELVATVVHKDGSDRYIFNIKDFGEEQVHTMRQIGIMQKRVMAFVLVRLREILVSNARMFLREEVHRSERIEL